MKLLCVSDQIDPLVYSTLAKERFADCDGVLCAGDLPSDYIDFIVSTLNKPTFFIFGNHNLSEFGYYHKKTVKNNGPHPQKQEEHSIFDMRGSFGASYAGFKCLKEKKLPVKFHVEAKNSKKKEKTRPLLIAGASGSKRYNNGLNQYTEFQMMLRLIKMIPRLLLNKLFYGTFVDIFLTHASPRFIHDREDPCHQGFECFRWFLRKFKPAYLVHGHIHLYDMNEERISKYFETTVINAYSHFILEFDENDENKKESDIIEEKKQTETSENKNE